MPNKRKLLKISKPHLWYLIGLITSDGCLSSDGRHIDITAKDYSFLDTLRRKIGFKNKVGMKNKGRINEAYHIQLSNKNLYDFLLSIGLSPSKSLIQREVVVPERYFIDFCRGVIDGDGNIRRWEHSSNKVEQWSLRIYSPSLLFLEWLRIKIRQHLAVKGNIHHEKGRGRRVDLYILKYGKLAAKEILRNCYYEGAIALDRKARLAKECCLSADGWTKSKTVMLN